MQQHRDNASLNAPTNTSLSISISHNHLISLPHHPITNPTTNAIPPQQPHQISTSLLTHTTKHLHIRMAQAAHGKLHPVRMKHRASDRARFGQQRTVRADGVEGGAVDVEEG